MRGCRRGSISRSVVSPQYRAFLQEPAQRFLDGLSDLETRKVRRLIWLIELDPFVDGKVKIMVDMHPIVFTVYCHPDYWIMYHMSTDYRISVDAISPAWPPPTWAPIRL